jgi:hypothetical protein
MTSSPSSSYLGATQSSPSSRSDTNWAIPNKLSKAMNQLKHDFIFAHGIQYMTLFETLEKAGMYYASIPPHIIRNTDLNSFSNSQTPRRPYSYTTLISQLGALVEEDSPRQINPGINDSDIQTEKDYSYVYSGYAPISVRIVDRVTNAYLPTHGNSTTSASGIIGEYQSYKPETKVARQSRKDQDVQNVLVVYLGGVTRAEVAALKFMNERDGDKRKYTVFATDVISGTSFIDGLIDH